MTLSEIEKVLEKRAVIAVNHATELIMKDMSEAIADYYGDYPNPKRYNRTGLLKSTPKVFKAPAFSGNSATAEIGLNTDLQYHTGTWGMSNVISSAENNLHGGYAFGSGVRIWTIPNNRMGWRLDEGCAFAGF